jgi:hypothetical protein
MNVTILAKCLGVPAAVSENSSTRWNLATARRDTNDLCRVAGRLMLGSLRDVLAHDVALLVKETLEGEVDVAAV